MKSSRWDIGIDITRIVAFMSVLSVHFFLNTGFYSEPVLSKRMYIMVVIRTFFMICVPLFMLLTGYLMSDKRIPLTVRDLYKHVMKLKKVLMTYALSMAAIFIFRIKIQNENIHFLNCALDFLGFGYYSWYVEMYIGLYLLIPFLNTLLQAMDSAEKSRQTHLFLIGILFSMTVLPTVFNTFDFLTAGALKHPWTATAYNKIFPAWWKQIYPIMYYYMGAYIKKHVDVKKLNTFKLSVALFFSTVLFGVYNIWRSYSVTFIWGDWQSWSSLQCVVEAVLAFLVINSIDFHQPGERVGRFLRLISELTFGAYLTSWIPDQYIYPRLNAFEPRVQMRIGYSIPSVLISITVSMTLAFIIHVIIEAIDRANHYIRGRIAK